MIEYKHKPYDIYVILSRKHLENHRTRFYGVKKQLNQLYGNRKIQTTKNLDLMV